MYACLCVSVCVWVCGEKPKTRNSWGKPATHIHTHAHAKLKKGESRTVQFGWYFLWVVFLFLGVFFFCFYSTFTLPALVLMNEWSIEWISVVCVGQFLKFFKLTPVVVVVLSFKYMHTHKCTYMCLSVCMYVFIRVRCSCVIFYSACAAFQRCLLTLK